MKKTKIDLTSVGFLFNGNKVLLIYHTKYKMWIGAGGHIDENETPDTQLLIEMRKELGVNVKILGGNSDTKVVENTIRVCPIPFHADVHDVGDHLHYAQYYVCVLSDPKQEIVPEANEIKEYKWFTLEEIEGDKSVEEKTKIIVRMAFEAYKSYI